MGSNVGKDKELVSIVTKVVKEVAKIPVWAKLTPSTTDIVVEARGAFLGGADAIVSSNTFTSLPLIDSETLEFEVHVDGLVSTGGLGGPAILPLSLAKMSQLTQAFPDKSFSGIGGISTFEHALNYFLLGCGTVQVCTAAMLDHAIGPNIIKELNEGLARFLEKHADKGWTRRRRLRRPAPRPRRRRSRRSAAPTRRTIAADTRRKATPSRPARRSVTVRSPGRLLLTLIMLGVLPATARAEDRPWGISHLGAELSRQPERRLQRGQLGARRSLLRQAGPILRRGRRAAQQQPRTGAAALGRRRVPDRAAAGRLQALRGRRADAGVLPVSEPEHDRHQVRTRCPAWRSAAATSRATSWRCCGNRRSRSPRSPHR